MHQRARFFAATIIILALVATGYFIGRSYNSRGAGAASYATNVNATPGSTSVFYLDIGASASLGFQPTGIVHHNGRRTSAGYANDLVLLEAYKGVALTLDQIGCPGETVESILSTTMHSPCYTLPQTQMTRAIALLQANQGQSGVVTVDLGFNDIRKCFLTAVADETCVDQAITAVGIDLPKIMNELKNAAGPKVRIIGLEYGDPYLAYFLNGLAGPANAAASLAAFDRLNAELAKVYTDAGASVANVPAFFQTDNSTRVTMANVGAIPENVAQACSLTWMCYSAPFGPDDHPNDAGYALIAQAIAAQLPKSW